MPEMTSFLVRKEAPMVEGTEEVELNVPAVYRCTMLVLPTP